MTSIGHLTRSECEQIVSNLNKSYTLKDVEFVPFCDSTRGFLGTHVRMTLKVETGNGEQKEISCFVKALEGGNLSLCLSDAQIFEKELFVYNMLKRVKSLLPEVKADVAAKLLFCNEKTQTLVLENLCEQGFKGKDEYTMDEAHMLVVIEALAKFHSVSIAYEEMRSKELERAYRLDEDYESILETMFTSDVNKSGHKFITSATLGAETLVDLVVSDDALIEGLKDKVRARMELYFDAVNDTRKWGFRKVLSHGDLWSFNAVYKYDSQGNPIQAKLVDFQLCRYTPPAHDLTMVTYMASDRHTFQKNLKKYYKHYYETLSKELKDLNINIVSVIDKEEFDITCRLFMKVAKFTWLCYRETSQSKDEVFGKLAEDVDTLFSVVLGEGRRWYVKQNFKEDEVYRKSLSGILWDNIYHLNNDGVDPEDCFDLIQRKFGNVDYDYFGHTVKKNGDGKYDLLVKIRRDGKDEELKFVLDNVRDNVIGSTCNMK